MKKTASQPQFDYDQLYTAKMIELALSEFSIQEIRQLIIAIETELRCVREHA